MNEFPPALDGLPVVIMNTDWKGIILGAVLVGFFTGITVYLGVMWSRKTEDRKEQIQILRKWWIFFSEVVDNLKSPDDILSVQLLRLEGKSSPLDATLVSETRNSLQEKFSELLPREESISWVLATRFEIEIDLNRRINPAAIELKKETQKYAEYCNQDGYNSSGRVKESYAKCVELASLKDSYERKRALKSAQILEAKARAWLISPDSFCARRKIWFEQIRIRKGIQKISRELSDFDRQDQRGK
ncbi:hypothetical protein RTZ71_22280 [Rhodococcus qingshengii]|uniref:hypothetical protein n=1 Tax=Rhodococcus qingshengii TaxID=334542 RepID=UPI0028F3316F|nr:hypothetical protein [Rhodococcus qingshengii]MDT9663442.1 hypothetical protein [Rhodococcus qingshengii]